MIIAVKRAKGQYKRLKEQDQWISRDVGNSIVINAIFSVKKMLQVCGGGCSGTTHNQPGAWRSGVECQVPALYCTVLHCTVLHRTLRTVRRSVRGGRWRGLHYTLHFHASVRDTGSL